VTPPPELRPLADDPGHSAILLDFDGTLAEIVARPELSHLVEGAAAVLRDACELFGAVVAISGRPTDDVRALVGVDGVRYLGLYGLESQPEAGRVPETVHAVVRDAAIRVTGAWVEDKGGSVAVHYRQADDADRARAELLGGLRGAIPDGYEAIEGKMVVDVVPAGRPRKGGAVRRVVGDLHPAAALYAGDDLADLEAFEELAALRADGVHAVRIAVRGPETPTALVEAADLTVDGPVGLVELLRALVDAAA
jgi:trehalose 6-phosphate phosphatase